MAEILTLPTAVDPPKTVFRISLLAFDWQHSTIKAHVREFDPASGAFGERVIIAQYSGSAAMAVMLALNKANLSQQSLHQRVMARLVSDGKIPTGTVSGLPE